MAEAVTRALGGSAACIWEAEPPQGHDLAELSHEITVFLRAFTVESGKITMNGRIIGEWFLKLT